MKVRPFALRWDFAKGYASRALDSLDGSAHHSRAPGASFGT